MAALTGIRVVDFSRVLAGPHCAQTLLDLGADVIKIEPPSGDTARRAFPRIGEISGYYAQQNAGKRNISIDLNVEGAREIALRLCDEADIIVENFRPGTLAGFGLGYDDVAARNSHVVYASISGYGPHTRWLCPAASPTPGRHAVPTPRQCRPRRASRRCRTRTGAARPIIRAAIRCPTPMSIPGCMP